MSVSPFGFNTTPLLGSIFGTSSPSSSIDPNSIAAATQKNLGLFDSYSLSIGTGIPVTAGASSPKVGSGFGMTDFMAGLSSIFGGGGSGQTQGADSAAPSATVQADKAEKKEAKTKKSLKKAKKSLKESRQNLKDAKEDNSTQGIVKALKEDIKEDTTKVTKARKKFKTASTATDKAQKAEKAEKKAAKEGKAQEPESTAGSSNPFTGSFGFETDPLAQSSFGGGDLGNVIEDILFKPNGATQVLDTLGGGSNLISSLSPSGGKTPKSSAKAQGSSGGESHILDTLLDSGVPGIADADVLGGISGTTSAIFSSFKNPFSKTTNAALNEIAGTNFPPPKPKKKKP